MTTHQQAISTHLYHDQRLTLDHLREIAAHGFAAIELFATRTHFDYHNRAAIDALAEWLEETGVILHSVHAPISESLVGTKWGGMFTNASTDEPSRARAVAESRAALAIAQRIPYHYLVIHLGIPDALKPAANDNQPDAAQRSIVELHGIAQAVGVKLALEVIPNRLSSAEVLVDFVENELDLPDIGICMDFGHAFMMGDLVDAIETASGYLMTTHIHDNHGKTDDHLVPFDGEIDWASALMAAQKIGYDGALMLEVANTATPTQVLTASDRARRRFEEILGQ